MSGVAGRGRRTRGPAETPASRVSGAPSAAEREVARAASAALRAAIADPSTMGEPSVMHVDYAHPRRSAWITTWPGLPGFVRADGQTGRSYTHDALPGWEYRRHEIKAEMIPDLDLLAERSEWPTVATR